MKHTYWVIRQDKKGKNYIYPDFETANPVEAIKNTNEIHRNTESIVTELWRQGNGTNTMLYKVRNIAA